MPSAESPSTNLVQLELELPEAHYEALRQIAEARDTEMQEIIAEAISNKLNN